MIFLLKRLLKVTIHDFYMILEIIFYFILTLPLYELNYRQYNIYLRWRKREIVLEVHKTHKITQKENNIAGQYSQNVIMCRFDPMILYSQNVIMCRFDPMIFDREIAKKAVN